MSTDYYPEPYYAPGWSAPRPRTDPVAVAALVTAVMGLGLVGVGLGVWALRRTRRDGTGGRGLAVAAVVVGAAWTVAAVAALVVVTTVAASTRPLSLDVAAPVDVAPGRLVTGHCLGELPPDGEVARVRVVPCDEPHDAQVVSQYRFRPDEAWPGQQAADARVARGCTLSAAEVEAGDTAVTWAPTEQTWARGDRTGLCLVVHPADGT